LDLGNPLLVGAALLSIGAAVANWSTLKHGTRRYDPIASTLGVAAFASVTAALALMTWLAWSSDLTYRYVWAHSSTTMDGVYRISSVWAAGEGALLLSAWCIGLALSAETLNMRLRATTGVRFQRCHRATMSSLLFVFSAMALSAGLFDRTTETELLSAPSGLGMDFSLRTPEMVIHAPVIFGAYACLAALFSASLGRLLTADEHWAKAALFWGRLGWLLLTIGIAVGAIWAYYVIGWGGYWAWDPVETASLLPWFMATAFLHTQMRRSSGDEYALASPALGMLSFAGVVFVSFIVRAGGLWEASVHDYGFSEGSSAVSRLVSLLGEEPSVAGTFAFLLGLVVLSAAAVFFASRRAPPARSRSPRKTATRLSQQVNDKDTMYLAIVLISVTSLLALILLFKNMGSNQASTYLELNEKMSVFFVALMVTMSICLTWRLIGRERVLWAAAAILAASVILAVASNLFGWFDPLVAFSLPSYLVATVSSAVKLVAAAKKEGGILSRLYRTAAQVAHLGVALLLVGFVISSNLESFPDQGYDVGMPVGSELEIGDYRIRLVAIDVTDEVSTYPEEVAQVRTAYVEVSRDGKVVDEAAALRILYSLDSVSGYRVLEIVRYVRSDIDGDLHLSYEWMSDDIVLMHAKVVPMMSLLWAGAILLCLGMSTRLLAWRPGTVMRPS